MGPVYAVKGYAVWFCYPKWRSEEIEISLKTLRPKLNDNDYADSFVSSHHAKTLLSGMWFCLSYLYQFWSVLSNARLSHLFVMWSWFYQNNTVCWISVNLWFSEVISWWILRTIFKTYLSERIMRIKENVIWEFCCAEFLGQSTTAKYGFWLGEFNFRSLYLRG